jgi:Mrp family chromosome partitioning ATPase
MEKLKAALEKARDGRERPGPVPRPVHDPRSRTGGGGQDQLWQDLPEIALADDVLWAHNVVTREASERATPFDILRTKVLLQMQQNGWSSLAVTSPMPKSGKTTTACNLALGVGRQGGLRTILFDMDLQKPSIAEFLGHTPRYNISDMLSGQVSFAEQAVRVGQNVAISASQRSEPDPTRILFAAQTLKTLEQIQAAYAPDIIIFDMPSILVGDNTRAFLKNVDCALIVARANSTRYSHFDTCEHEVAEYTHVVGTVLNAFRTKKRAAYTGD